MLSSICFMPASLVPQSLPPGSPTMAWYFGDSTVVTCMRAGLYQTKNGFPVFLGSLRSRKSITLAEISSSTVLDSVERQRTLVLACLVRLRAVARMAPEHRPRWCKTSRGLGVNSTGNLGNAGYRRIAAWWRDALHERRLIEVRKTHPLHRIEVIEVAPIFLEPVRRRQRRGVVAQMVLAELTRVVAEINQELGEGGSTRLSKTGYPAAAAGSCRSAADTCQ
jgi:hypothetical protein